MNALVGLVDDPQNNFRVWVNGQMIKPESLRACVATSQPELLDILQVQADSVCTSVTAFA
jgi:hypothetical protein